MMSRIGILMKKVRNSKGESRSENGGESVGRFLRAYCTL